MPRLELEDQASGLRRLLGEQQKFRPVGIFGPDPSLNASAAAGIAFALTQRGGHVCLIDEAPAPHNVAGQLGLTPRLGLAELAQGYQTLHNCLVGIPEGPYLLRAEQGLAWVAQADDRNWSRVAEDFSASSWEWLLLSAPADERPSLALTTPLRILVLPASKPRLTEAYTLLKAANRKQSDANWLAMFMNVTDVERSDQLMASLNKTSQRFLGIEISLLGAVPKDEKHDMAIRSMRPVHQVAPSAPAAIAFRQAAERLHEATFIAGMDARTFWQRLGLFSRLNRPPRSQPTHHVQRTRAYG